MEIDNLETKPSYLKEFIGHYILLDEIIKRAVDTKKIDDFERYIDKFIELYVNTIGESYETD